MGEREMGRVLGLRTKILKETRKLRNVSRHPLRLVVARGPSSPQARARPGRVGLEQEAEGLRLQAAAAAGDLQTHPRVTGH